MNKKLLASLFAALVLAVSTAYAQTEADFNVVLTEDGEGAVTGGIPEKSRRYAYPPGVTKIGGSAFSGCSKLTSHHNAYHIIQNSLLLMQLP